MNQNSSVDPVVLRHNRTPLSHLWPRGWGRGLAHLACSPIYLLTLMPCPSAQAQGFSALISPPRVETTIKPGKTTRQVIEITQVAALPGKFRVYTADWKFGANGSLDFSEELKPDSCRPWVALERRDLNLQANSKTRYRVEITPPADAPATECTFAIMFEGLDTSAVKQGQLNFPVSGRIAVIVYANMPGTQPELKILKHYVSTDDAKLPTLDMQNTGKAHGRLAGLLTGTDAKGVKLEFTPMTLPVLPGETRAIGMSATTENGKAVTTIAYPITIKGSLEWGGKREPFEYLFKTQ
jgi:hypothetical protein